MNTEHPLDLRNPQQTRFRELLIQLEELSDDGLDEVVDLVRTKMDEQTRETCLSTIGPKKRLE